MARRSLTVALVACASCARGGGSTTAASTGPESRPSFDWSAPTSSLSFTADEAARRLGSFDYSAQVSWSTTRGAERTQAVEKHLVRQLASGDFRSLVEIDPGTWPGAETGREIVFSGGLTFARSRYAPFRERPTDRGRDARRFRDESFRLAGDLSALLGARLRAEPRGETTALGRRARRFALVLADQPPTSRGAAGGKPDEDTQRRLDFLEGCAPVALQGELLLDDESGVPLAVRLRTTLGQASDPRLRVELDLDARIAALGDAVGGVATPRGALPDERKPRGVARALDQAGLRQRPEPGATEPDDEGE